jgi:ADP-ribose pyrophosphatase YjhB (NUDIX family)
MADRHESEGERIFVRARCVIIHGNKLLVTYSKEHDFYFFPGGHMIWGESVIEGCKREIKEELGDDVEFEFKKVLYIREFVEKDKGKHSLELFILGDINKFEELEGRVDPEHENGQWWSTWVDLKNLPANLFPIVLAKRVTVEYKEGFPSGGEYVGVI